MAVVTGEGFGSAHHIRISYASDDETLERAIQRIQGFYSKKNERYATSVKKWRDTDGKNSYN